MTMPAHHLSVPQGRAGTIVRAARGWLGTPYRHQASAKGAGCDCLGLLRGVWREVMGREPETPPPYARDGGLEARAEPLLEAARRSLVEIAPASARAGDVVLFRWRHGGPARHCGILTAPLGPGCRFIHAWERMGCVEVSLAPAWASRIAAAFAFPPEGSA